MKLSWVQSAALYNVAHGRLPWERIRAFYKMPMTKDALVRRGLMRHDKEGWYELTARGKRWVEDHPPDEGMRQFLEIPEQLPGPEIEEVVQVPDS